MYIPLGKGEGVAIKEIPKSIMYSASGGVGGPNTTLAHSGELEMIIRERERRRQTCNFNASTAISGLSPVLFLSLALWTRAARRAVIWEPVVGYSLT